MKRTLVIALLISTLAAGAPAVGGELDAVVIHAKTGSPSGPFPGWTTEPRGSTTRFELGLGDTLESTVIEVVPNRGDAREIAVQFQIETSVTIMEDGPHVDLLDWKHHTSEWVDLERIDELKFRMPVFDYGYEMVSTFPAYTVEELVEAAMAAGGERWAELARRWPDPDDGRIGVGISTVRVRIRARDAAGWSTLYTIDVGVPMGC